jgi:hypothetical protein
VENQSNLLDYRHACGTYEFTRYELTFLPWNLCAANRYGALRTISGNMLLENIPETDGMHLIGLNAWLENIEAIKEKNASNNWILTGNMCEITRCCKVIVELTFLEKPPCQDPSYYVLLICAEIAGGLEK